MPRHSKLWYLERFRLLDVLNHRQKQIIELAARMSEVKRGQRIYMPGDPSEQIFLLKAGVVKIASVAEDGREIILAFLHAGDIFGELAVVDDSPRDHLAEAYEDAVICAVDRRTFLHLLEQSPALGYQIVKLMGLRLKTFRTRVEELLCKSAQHRVAHTLLWLAEQHGVRDAAGVLIPLRLMQRDIGNLVGLSRESVNAILKDFRTRGLAEFERRSIRISDPEGLRAVR